MKGNKQSNIISVISTSPRTGNSTVAINLAYLLKTRGHSVLYISFEHMPTSNFFIEEQQKEKDMSNIIFYIKQGNKCRDITYRIKENILTHSKYKFDYISPPKLYSEYQELNNLELAGFLKKIIEIGNYEYIVLDLDSRIDYFNSEIFIWSDKIFYLINHSKFDLRSKEFRIQFEEYYLKKNKDIQKKLVTIINRYINGMELNVAIPNLYYINEVAGDDLNLITNEIIINYLTIVCKELNM